MNFTTTVVLESKTVPGARVTCKKFSRGRQSALLLKLAEYHQQLADLYAKMKLLEIDWGEIEADDRPEHLWAAIVELAGGVTVSEEAQRKILATIERALPEKIRRPGDSPEERNRKVAAMAPLRLREQAITEAYLKPEVLRTYVKTIEGFTIDDAPATVDAVIAEGFMEFADEIYDFIQENSGLGPDLPNSQSPAISVGAAGETTNSTIATPAEPKVSGATETAASTSPSA